MRATRNLCVCAGAAVSANVSAISGKAAAESNFGRLNPTIATPLSSGITVPE